MNFFNYRTPEELYNDQEDPNALNNLADKERNRAMIKKMHRMLTRWMKEKQDPLLPYYLGYTSGRGK